ncbi:MAG: response regulator transcription factor, partial [Candidatus Eremiobacteraeota bacterium]|nr:response regulator transcription factor [Candidatus Eremiobacteraeota bacterium]
MGKVFLIDDHSLVRGGFSRLVCQLPGFEVVGEASSIEEALPLLRDCHAEIVTLDLALPGLSGRNAVKLLQESCPDSRILI